MSRRTRSGLQFSPFQVTETPNVEYAVIRTSSDLSRLVEQAFAAEDNREEDLEDDTEGLELDYTPPNSPTSRAQNVSDSELSSLSELSEDQPSQSNSVAKWKGRTGKGHAKRGAKKRRKAKRAQQCSVHPSQYRIKESRSEKYQDVQSVQTDFQLADLPIAQGAHIGLRFDIEEHIPTLQEVLAEGLELEEWDGV